MRYVALATDYDGTLAEQGVVAPRALEALERLRASGRRLVLVTGRELDDLQRVFPGLGVFDRVVAENGALLFNPATREERLLAEAPPRALVARLRERGVSPLSSGRVIVATVEPHQTTIVETIRDLGLELQVIFNKGAVMVLPSGVNKGTGLEAALEELKLSRHNVVGIGDAENDHAFLSVCECAVAVATAIPALKQHADYVTRGGATSGVLELVDRLLADDLRSLDPKLRRHDVVIGTLADGNTVRLPPARANLLLVGQSGAGKSTLATGFLERVSRAGYQFCLLDPEGDHEALEDAITLGTGERPPSVDEVLQVLEAPDRSAVANLIALPLADRPVFFSALLPRLQQLRARSGRPHWIVVDEAHHLMPRGWRPTSLAIPSEVEGYLLITVHPEYVDPGMLARVDYLLAVGRDPREPLRGYRAALGEPAPSLPDGDLEPGEAWLWAPRAGDPPLTFRVAPPESDRRRTAASTLKATWAPSAASTSADPRAC